MWLLKNILNIWRSWLAKVFYSPCLHWSVHNQGGQPASPLKRRQDHSAPSDCVTLHLVFVSHCTWYLCICAKRISNILKRSPFVMKPLRSVSSFRNSSLISCSSFLWNTTSAKYKIQNQVKYETQNQPRYKIQHQLKYEIQNQLKHKIS